MAAERVPELRPAPPTAVEARLQRWRDRSRSVRRLRVAAPAAIAVIVVAVVAWIGIGGLLNDLHTVKASAGGLHMTNPRFFGRDESGRAFTLQAVEAERDAHDLDRITLSRPSVSLDHGTERPTTAHAPSGVYTESRKKLLLTGGVELDDGKGTHLVSPSAEVDIHTGDVDGRGDVTGTSPLGRFQASAYFVRDKGDNVTFFGGVHAHLFNGSEGPHP